ncbi:MAG: NAD-dependent epimerase/dehydratase family protein [Tannerellaceae bacterium]|nr:NAD-dependent epimerase/dehydratase family protein [Tannerellaceae bacterium]
MAISGAGGFIGSYLSDYFRGLGNQIIPLHREIFQTENQEKLDEIMTDCNVVINLAGTSVFTRWTEKRNRKF